MLTIWRHNLSGLMTKSNKMPILAFTRDAVADSFIPTVCLGDL